METGVAKTGPKRIFDPSREELNSLYQEYSMAAIAEIFGVGETVVWKRVKEFGLVREDGRKKRYRKRSRAHSINISLAHRGKWSGSKNPNWKGGIYESHLAIRRTGEYRQWKIAALERANNRCEECGVENGSRCTCCGTKVSLHVHHLRSFATFPEGRFDPENSEVLCPKCHHSRHHGKSGEFGGPPNVKSRAIPSEAAEG